jgi:hypothetical protein
MCCSYHICGQCPTWCHRAQDHKPQARPTAERFFQLGVSHTAQRAAAGDLGNRLDTDHGSSSQQAPTGKNTVALPGLSSSRPSPKEYGPPTLDLPSAPSYRPSTGDPFIISFPSCRQVGTLPEAVTLALSKATPLHVSQTQRLSASRCLHIPCSLLDCLPVSLSRQLCRDQRGDSDICLNVPTAPVTLVCSLPSGRRGCNVPLSSPPWIRQTDTRRRRWFRPPHLDFSKGLVIDDARAMDYFCPIRRWRPSEPLRLS